MVKEKVKINLELPIAGLETSLGLQAVQTLRIFRQLAHGGGKVVSPKHQPALFPKL